MARSGFVFRVFRCGPFLSRFPVGDGRTGGPRATEVGHGQRDNGHDDDFRKAGAEGGSDARPAGEGENSDLDLVHVCSLSLF